MLMLRTDFKPMAWAVGLLAAFLALWRLGAAELEVSRHDLRPATHSPAVRVVQLSDLHLQRFAAAEQAIVARVLSLKPDLVVLSGDAIDRAEALPHLRSFVQALAGVSVVAVPGNWEHWSGIDFSAMDQIFADRPGSAFLLNQRLTLTVRGRMVHVLGLDDFTAGQPDAQRLSVQMPGDLNILVQHSPGFFDLPEVARRMGSSPPLSLCLSGHTHGGQIALAGWAPFRPVGSGRFVAGFYDVPGCRLYVSRGVGTSVLPLRWGAAPEVAVFDL
ncbi:MAG: metallophosphoesterase [Limnohabitans sp.]